MDYSKSVDKTWQLKEAEARFSQLVEEAMKGQPQVVAIQGGKAVVVLDWGTYARLTGKKQSPFEIRTPPKMNLWQALRPAVPLANEEVEALFARAEVHLGRGPKEAEPRETSS